MTLVTDLEIEIARVADRLRSMPLTRVAAPWPPYESRAAGARALAQRLADLAAEASGQPSRTIPDVGDAAVGDQVAVTGADLARSGADDRILVAAVEDLRQVRLSL